jgi:hypothetical protein
MTNILYRMGSGVPGTDTRPSNSTIEQKLMSASAPFSAFGLPGKMSAGSFVPLVAGDVADSIFGWLVRSYPGGTPSVNDPLGTSTPSQAGGFGNGMRRGYMNVKCNAGTPADGGQVYVRVANPTSPKPIGGVEAALDYTAASVTGTNTGNGTLGTLSAVSGALAGAYVVTMLTATTFSVIDPTGVRLKDGVNAAAYSAEGITFTVTAGGTAFVAGDKFTVTVTQNTVAVPRTFFAGSADASGNTEISIRI